MIPMSREGGGYPIYVLEAINPWQAAVMEPIGATHSPRIMLIFRQTPLCQR
jgi:hypothetical protein